MGQRANIVIVQGGDIEVFYNRKRLHSTLGYQSPLQYMEDWLNGEQKKLVA